MSYKQLSDSYQSGLKAGFNQKINSKCPGFAFTFIGGAYVPFKKFLEQSTDKCGGEDLRSQVVGLKKLLEENGRLSINDLDNRLNRFIEIYQNKLAKAEEQGKKLLILLGETHDLQSSTLLEMLFLSYLKTQGFENIQSEYEKDFTNRLESGSIKSLGTNVFHHLFKMKIIPADTNRIKEAVSDTGDVVDYSKLAARNSAIKKNIVEKSSDHQVGIFGRDHLLDIANHKPIKDKYVVLPIDVSINVDIAPQELRSVFENSESQGTVRFTFDHNIESFTAQRMAEIFGKFLKYKSGEMVNPDTVFEAKFDISKDKGCEYFAGKMKSNLAFIDKIDNECNELVQSHSPEEL